MELLTKPIRLPSRSQWIHLTPLGDLHLGAAGCDEDALKAKIAEIAADPFHFTVLMGDMVDAVLPDDKRWDEKAVPKWLSRGTPAKDEFERVVELFKPIPPTQILGVLEGNHEITTRTRHYLDITLDLARTLKCPYLGQEAIVRMLLRRSTSVETFDLFVTHGSGGGRKPGAKINRVTDLSNFIDADIFMMGHVHEKTALKNVVLSMDHGGNLAKKERVYVLTGTYLKTYQEGSNSYGARALYAPTAIGAPTLHIKPDTRQVEVTV
jgi:hypothetical protein